MTFIDSILKNYKEKNTWKGSSLFVPGLWGHIVEYIQPKGWYSKGWAHFHNHEYLNNTLTCLYLGAMGLWFTGSWGPSGTARRKQPVGRPKCKSWERNNYSSHLPSLCLVEAMAQWDAAGQEWRFHPAGITRSSWSCQTWQNNMLSQIKALTWYWIRK